MNLLEPLFSLSVQGWWTLAVVLGMTIVIARDRLGPDLAMFSALSILLITQVVTPVRALEGFSNKAIITIGSLFVVAAAMRETGALAMISRILFGTVRSPFVGLLRMVLPTALLSAFINNTPVVAMGIPVVREFSKRVGERPSRFLMPLAYAAMLGGTCTLIGTSSNLVISGLLHQNNLTELGMLDISWIGVPTMVVGVVYLMTVGHRLLQTRKSPNEKMNEERREYLAEVVVAEDSPLVGKTVEGAGLRNLPGLFLAEIRRANGRRIRPVAPENLLLANDHLVLSGVASTVQDLQSFPGLNPIDEPTAEIELERGLFEVVISHRSNLIGRTLRDVGFRRRYNAAVLAVHRAGERIEQRIGDIILRPGDTLMLSAAPGFYDTWRNHVGFYLISSVPAHRPPRYRNAHFSMVVVLALVLVPTLTNIDMMTAAVAAVTLFIATKCISPRAVRQSIDWSVLLVIGSALGISAGLQDSGAADAIGLVLVHATQPAGPLAIIAAIYLLGVVSASLLTNAAGAALVFPIALKAAHVANLDPRPVAIIVALSASAAFATPLGSNAILLISGPGGYRYRDFLKVGLPLNILCLFVALTVLPMVWSLHTDSEKINPAQTSTIGQHENLPLYSRVSDPMVIVSKHSIPPEGKHYGP